jgi:syntaxin 16
MERDRTKKFLKLRSQNIRPPQEGGNVAVTVEEVPPWMRFVEEIRSDLATNAERMRRLSELHQKHLLQSFDMPTTLEKDIDIMTREITSCFRHNHKKLEALAQTVKSRTPEDNALRKNLRMQLVREIQQMGAQFRSDQSAYLTRLKEINNKVSLVPIQVPGIGEVSDEDDVPVPIDFGMLPDQRTIVRRKRDQQERQSKQIHDLVRSINELADIMNDLAMVVHDQSSILERIDYNIEHTEHYIVESVKTLVDTKKAAKSTKTKLCIMVLAILIVVMLFILILKLSLSSG